MWKILITSSFQMEKFICRSRINRKNDGWRGIKIKLIKIKGLIALECKMEKERIEIIYENIDNVKIKMFKVDLEAYIS